MDTIIVVCGIVGLAIFICFISMSFLFEEFRDIGKIIMVIDIFGIIIIGLGIILDLVDPVFIYNKELLYNSPEFQSSYRVATLEIKTVNIEDNVVLLEDTNGFQYHFEGVEDWCVGDLVSCLMYTQDTPSVYDDEIVQKRYSGFNVERIGK